MDILIIAASSGLTAWLPRYLSNHGLSSSSRLPSVTIVFGLSLGLFSLGILEVIPQTYFLLLARDGYLTVTAAYRLLLWLLCLWIVVIVPALVGAELMERLSAMFSPNQNSDPDDNKYSRAFLWRVPWWIRTCSRLVLAPLSRIKPFSLFWKGGKRHAEPVLVVTTQDTAEAKLPSTWQRVGANLVGSTVGRKSIILGSIFGLVSNLVFFRGLGAIVVKSSSEEVQILPTVVSWLCSVGLLLSSVLNGFGSASLPHSCLVGFYLEPIHPETMAKAEEDLRKMTSALEAKRFELESSSPTAALAPSAGRRRSDASVPKTFSQYGDEASKRKTEILRQIKFYETLHEELGEEVAEMKHSQKLASMARTSIGRIRAWLGFAFSIVLLIRLFAAMLIIWRTYYVGNSSTRTSRSDPITTALLFLTGHNLVSQQEYNTLSHCISLLLTAFLSVSQVRTFLRTVAAVNRRLFYAYRNCYCSRSGGHDMSASGHPSKALSHSYSHLLGSLMGCYFLSCIILTKMNLPKEYRSDFSAALGGMKRFQIQSAVTNVVFSVSAVVSAATLGLLFGIQRQNTKRHAISLTDDATGDLDLC